MKLLTWNIRQGGSDKQLKRLPSVVGALLKHSADVMVLTEYWEGEKGEFIKDKLSEYGYKYDVSSKPELKQNGVFIASRFPFNITQASIKNAQERWVQINFPQYNLEILGIHIPTVKSKLHHKVEFWQEVKKYAKENINNRSIIIGDFNTGLRDDAEGTPLSCREDMQEVLDMGWIDSWRYIHGNRREYSWFSKKRDGGKNGFRIDHIFITPLLRESLLECYFSHQEREENISDHSILIVELDM